MILGKTPVHVILELDNKIADNDTKLQIIKFLDEMGAPMDLPDVADVWPIHLAVAIQSPEIVDYFIKKNVALNRKDGSLNTPLHYAVYGREVTCQTPAAIGSLVPSQKFEKLPLNKVLESASENIINLLHVSDGLNKDLIHLVNTIMKIPDMYAETDTQLDLESNIINIFVDVALKPTYPSSLTGSKSSNRLNTQQANLEQLIEKMYGMVNDDLLKGLTTPLSIDASNINWSNDNRIFEKSSQKLNWEIAEEYETIKKKIVSGSSV